MKSKTTKKISSEQKCWIEFFARVGNKIIIKRKIFHTHIPTYVKHLMWCWVLAPFFVCLNMIFFLHSLHAHLVIKASILHGTLFFFSFSLKAYECYPHANHKPMRMFHFHERISFADWNHPHKQHQTVVCVCVISFCFFFCFYQRSMLLRDYTYEKVRFATLLLFKRYLNILSPWSATKWNQRDIDIIQMCREIWDGKSMVEYILPERHTQNGMQTNI